MKVVVTVLLAILMAGCTKSNTKSQPPAETTDCRVFRVTSEGKICISEPALWFMACAPEIYINEGRRLHDGTIFTPQVDPAEEIFQKCESIKPLPADKALSYKKWLKDRISEIQSITPGTTQRKVNQILIQNGGLFIPSEITYSHKECDVLKVHIKFELASSEHKERSINEDDKVIAVSMPYLGFFTAD